ncbi:MAG: chromosome partitioning protein ParB [Candidatus Pacebacteria bacterium CG10_big_fil_rev_8_21_14_0_10_56_10]|nr:MAG: chromosome partitioning protein ParB [Candidatus Pacebacteria bacterium CG10_big_fil_rev_8_21_14_0_10_56_10]
MANDVTSLPLDQLEPNPFQPRERIKKEDIAELVDSIKMYGVIEPLVIAHTPAGYQIIAGERRWRAAREAGLAEVPVHVKETTPREMLEMALVENVQRSDLSPIERGQAFKQLTEDFGYTSYKIAERIGKSGPYVSNTLRLLKLPDAIKDGLIGGLISEHQARAFLGAKDERLMIECYKKVLKNGWGTTQTESYVRERVLAAESTESGAGQKQAGESQSGPYVTQRQVARWQKILKERLVERAKLNVSRSDRLTRITLSLRGSPQKTQADLDKIMAVLVGKDQLQP